VSCLIGGVVDEGGIGCRVELAWVGKGWVLDGSHGIGVEHDCFERRYMGFEFEIRADRCLAEALRFLFGALRDFSASLWSV
jgi:hypothetical protein